MRAESLGGLQSERGEDVARRQKRSCALPKEIVRPGRETGRDLAGDCEDLAAELQGEIGGDERAGTLARFHDHRRRAETGDDPVASWEAPRCGLRSRWIFGCDSPGRADLPRELCMASRVVAIDATAQDRDSPASGRERAPMSLSVDSAGQSAHHDEARSGEVTRELPGHLR